MQNHILEKFQAIVTTHLTDVHLQHMQSLAAALSDDKLPVLQKNEVLKLGMYAIPFSKLKYEGTKIGEVEGRPVLWIDAIGAYAIKDDPHAIVINTCHPYRQPGLKYAGALHS